MIITNLLTNMVVVVSSFYTIETNPPSFREYVFHETFNCSSNLIVGWNLDLPRPITTNMVTSFKFAPNLGGISCSITFSNRYDFSWGSGGFDLFHDESYVRERTLSPDVDANDALLEEWMRATNSLTVEKAQHIAESAMQCAGVPMDNVEFRKPAKIKQMMYEWKDGKTYAMPYYGFFWHTNGFPSSGGAYHVHVSGIVSNIVEFYCFPNYLKPIKPTNYFEMLGLPEHPVFVRRLSPLIPGQPPAYEVLADKN